MIIFPFFIHNSDSDPNSSPPSPKSMLIITALIFFAISGGLFMLAYLLNYGGWIKSSDNDPQLIITLIKIIPWILGGLSCLIGVLSLIRFLIYDKVDRY